MKKAYLSLTGRIRDEIAQAVNRVQVAWKRAEQTGDDFYLDSVALNLHSFYTGLKKYLS